MIETLSKRKEFVNEMMNYLQKMYDLNDTQIFLFGSFLTEDFVPHISDIDIGVYSENEAKMYDIKNDLNIYLDEFDIKHDIVIMHLNDNLWINIPIMTYGKQLTSYENEKLFTYLLHMVERWGFNPLDRMRGGV